MARAAKSWELRRRGKEGTLYVRFRFEGVRHERSTGTADPGSAAREAAKIYAEVVSGQRERHAAEAAGITSALPIDVLASKWLSTIEGATHATNTTGLFTLHMRTHLIPFFARLDRITPATVEDYQSKRLREVTRATLRKERMTLRLFLGWCQRRKLIHRVPDFPDIPRGATGTRATTRKQASVEVTAEQVGRFIAELPILSKGKIRQSHRFPVRARYVVAWETGLRPSTLDKIRVPEHYRRGAAELVIADEIDKARFGRTVPLTEAARAALDSVAPDRGLVFGKRDYRKYFAEASERAGMPDGFSPYDLRHGRALALLEPSGNLPGVAFLLGHKKMTTTDKYLKATRRAGDAVLSVASSSGANLGADVLSSAYGVADDSEKAEGTQPLVRRGGLEPPRCYPLAPQGSEHRRTLGKQQDSSNDERRRKRGRDGLIGGMPPELPPIAEALNGMVVEWDLYDRWLLAGGDQ